jgi:hypothetical protein
MQESQDRQFDQFIARALRADALPTPQQKQQAWETLRARVRHQGMLPPPAPTAFERLVNAARVFGKSQIITLYHLFLDDSPYCRVQKRYPIMMRHQRPHSTFAGAEFMLLA